MELGPQSHAAPQLAEPDRAERRRGAQPSGQGEQHLGDASLPDLMHEFRAGVQDALSWLDAARAEPAADATPPVSAASGSSDRAVRVRPLVSPALLEQMTLTLAEVRQALTELRAAREQGAVASDRVPAAASSELEQARLVALNMALNGAPRAETERYLQRNFGLQDGGEIAADAYQRAQGSGGA